MAEKKNKKVEKENADVPKKEEKTSAPKKEEKKVEKTASVPATKSETKNKKGSKADEPKIELEREYVVPLRKGFLKVPRYKRAKKAVRVLKEFLAKHMKVEDRDLKKVKVDRYLNEEIWFRGIKKPLNKVKVKATKKDGVVYVELAEMPEYVKFKKSKDEKKFKKVDEKAMKKVEKNEEAESEVKAGREQKEDEESKERKAAAAEAGEKAQEVAAKAKEHTTKGKPKTNVKQSQMKKGTGN